MILSVKSSANYQLKKAPIWSSTLHHSWPRKRQVSSVSVLAVCASWPRFVYYAFFSILTIASGTREQKSPRRATSWRIYHCAMVRKYAQFSHGINSRLCRLYTLAPYAPKAPMPPVPRYRQCPMPPLIKAFLDIIPLF